MTSPSRQQQPDQATAAQVASLTALVKAQAAIRERLTAQAVAMATQAAQSFHGWYDTDAITTWANGLATRIEAIQRLLAQSTDAYLARALTQTTGTRVGPVGKVDVTGLRAGVTHAGAYGRAADAYRWQQHLFDQTAGRLLTAATPEPFDLVTPVEAAVERVAKVADIDAQLAVRAQTQASLTAAADRGLATGYRRVIHPELSKGGTCGLCIAASDRLYHAAELMPFHAECHCTVLPVTEASDPGSWLNELDLKRVYKAAGGTHASLLKATRYRVDEHGELGPVLNRQGAPFRTARQAERDTNQTRRAKTAAEKTADLDRVRSSLEAALPRARDLAQSDPGTWGGYLHQLEQRITAVHRDTAA